MFFCALASDYDGTLAQDGKVDAPTREALSDLKAAGKRLILITGRELKDLHATFEYSSLFDAIVAENGAVLYLPGSQEERALAPAPPERFVAELIHGWLTDPGATFSEVRRHDIFLGDALA
jgi:hypothetical protein